MSESKKNCEINNGWILCPSKSFPGKFYYFNVVNGETAWSQNQAENKGLKKENSFQKVADISHIYPEPTTLPDESTITYDNIFKTKNPDYPQTVPRPIQLPTFGQVQFPNYVPNIEPIVPNVVWTLVPMLCPETRKPIFDKVSPTMEFQRELFSHSSNVPLCKRFKNYEKYSKFETSTPKNSFFESVPEPKSFVPKSSIKKPTSKLEQQLPIPNLPDAIKNYENTVLSLSSKIENAMASAEVPNIFEKDPVLENLERSDLRYLLLSKRKSFGPDDTAVERKKPKSDEIKPRTPKKKVTFNIKDNSDEETTDDFTPMTPNLSWSTIESPKSPFKLKDKVPPSFVKETYETLPPNAKNSTPTFPPIPTKQLPIFQLTTAKQQATYQQTGNNQASTFQPKPTNQLLTFQPTPSNHLPTFQSTAATANQTPTFQPTATNHGPAFHPTSTNQQTTFQPTPTNQQQTFQPTPANQQPTFKNTAWYVVADTDVLLLDFDFVEKLVLTDPKCRLVIPHMVVSDIEALCLGDCRGQQRVIKARQLTRKLATPPPHCIVEPRTSNGSLVVTTESILHCCLKAANKNYYVVLITNDPHLLIRATSLNIPAYKLNEIQYGIDISPKSVLEQKNIKINNAVTSTSAEKLLNQKRNVFSSFRDDKAGDKKMNIRSSIKQLSLSSDSESDVGLDDNILNETKSIENIGNTNSDSDISDIFVTSLQLKEKNVLKPQNVPKNPYYPQNVKNGFINFEKRILNPNAVFNANNLEIKISNENPKVKIDNHIFQNDYLDYNFENKDEFYPIPIPNIADSKPNSDNSTNKCLTLKHGLIRESMLRNPSQVRIEKIMNAVSTDETPTKETTAVFKIPKLLPIKKTKNKTTAHGENSIANVKIGTQTIDTVNQSLKSYRVKNKIMREKIYMRSEEWMCTFMQIMEDFLVTLLQKNKVCMENTVAPLTIKDTLNCVKMLYDSHTKVRDVINKLSELLDKCMIGVQGQIKMPIAPEYFMKIFGCGVLLVQALQEILPENEDLKDAKIRLDNLHVNLKRNIKESDPELVKSPYSNRTDKNDEEIRPPFFKSTGYVLDYLKKHFKEWESFEENLEEQNHKIENHNDFTVVRTLGKNLNLFKIDKRKNISLTNITEEDDSHNKNHDKIMRQIENKQIKESNNTETKLIRLDNDYDKNTIDLDFLSDELNKTDIDTTSVNKNTETTKHNTQQTQNKTNKEQKQNFEIKDEVNNIKFDNNCLDENIEKEKLNTIKKVDELELNPNTREPLDLDLLDYSEIYEPSIDKNVDFDVLSVNEKAEKNNNFKVDTPQCVETPVFTLEDFYITPTISPDSAKNNENIGDCRISNQSIDSMSSIGNGNVTSSNLNKESENNVTSSKKEEKNEKNTSEIESETYTEKENSINDKCVEKSETHNYDSGTHNYDSGTHNYDSGTHNYDSGTHIDDSDFGKTAQIVQNDSANDSGFENDSTYAHSLLKVFLKELCSTFTVIHTFINKFIDEISESEVSAKKMDAFHNQASKALEDMVAIISHLKAIIKRESPEDTALKMLLRNAGVEATADKRMMRYRAVVTKCLEQAQILEGALKIIISTTIGDFEALAANTENIHPDFRYFNIFEPNYQPFVGNT